MFYFAGSGDGVLSYRCIYRTLVEEESCHFTIVPDITITNQREYEDGEAPMKIKLTVSIVQNYSHTSVLWMYVSGKTQTE